MRKFKNPSFGFNLSEILSNWEQEDINLFQYYFDFINLKWRNWNELPNHLEYNVISSNQALNVLNYKEIIRLNPISQRMFELNAQCENEVDYKYVENTDSIYQPTNSMKKTRYLLDFFLAY